jgi:hypothetical protein
MAVIDFPFSQAIQFSTMNHWFSQMSHHNDSSRTAEATASNFHFPIQPHTSSLSSSFRMQLDNDYWISARQKNQGYGSDNLL